MFRHSMCHISDSEVKNLKTQYVALHGQFVLPMGYEGHTHTFKPLAAGVQLCTLCGAEHICFRGNCPEVESDEGGLVCTITGCVTTQYKLCPERDVHMRTSEVSTTSNRLTSRRNRPASRNGNASYVHRIQADQLHNTVTRVVHELLNSETTHKCMTEEVHRANAKIGVVLGRILRELNSNLAADARIDLIKVETTLAYTFRRLRNSRAIAIARQNIDELMATCIQSIVSIINQHGWYRTCRQLTHVPRGTTTLVMHTHTTHLCICVTYSANDNHACFRRSRIHLQHALSDAHGGHVQEQMHPT